MKSLLTSLLLVLCLSISAQDTIRIHHKSYTTVYSKSLMYPVLVEWWVTKSKVLCTTPVKRSDRFSPDPKLVAESDIAIDYKNSGLDRGHMSPAADNLCEGEEVMKESFYFTNMSPQYHSLNAGDWKDLEVLTRELAKQKDSIKVWAGSIGVQKKIGRVSVPVKCWKVIYIKKDKSYECYVFDNVSEKQQGLESKKVTLAEIKKLTKFKFSIK